jgi:cell division protein FtsZ
MKIIGVGTGGVAAARNLRSLPLEGVQWGGVDTDAMSLSHSGLAETRLMGVRLTRGLGTGGDPDLGRAAAEADVEAIRSLGANGDVIILLVGLGGGTGSGAAPVIARVLREAGKLVFALATLPFEFEGVRRQQQAQEALRQLRGAADAVVCLPNQKVASLLDANTTFVDTFKTTHRLLGQGIEGLWRLMTREAFIKVDFADLSRVVRGRHAESAYAAAEACGENRLREVLDLLFQSPLLDQGRWLNEADAVLVSVVGGQDMTLREINQLMEQIHRRCEKAEVIMGASFDGSVVGRFAVTLVASRRLPGPGTKDASEESETEDVEMPTCQFPVPGTRPAEAGGEQVSEGRTQSRFAAMAPSFPKDKLEEIFSRQVPTKEKPKRRSTGPRQGMLPLEAVSKGRFAKSEPTLHRGEDLDTPTYIRKGVPLN